jgi:branched-subunit amino acid ABC-type transport system permease component
MGRLLQTLVIGAISGSLYALIAMGMVLVYRTTGVLNIAHGGVGVLSGFVAWDLMTLRNWPYYAAVVAGVLLAVVIGLAFERYVIRVVPSPALQTVSTLGLFIFLQGIVFVVPWWSNTATKLFPSPLLDKRIQIPGADYSVGYDQIALVSAVAICLVGLYFVLRRTRIGLAMRATSDDPVAARLVGIRSQLVSPVVWSLAFGISGLTTMLIAPILFLDATSITALTLKALTVTFAGGLVSLPLTVMAALSLACLEAITQVYLPDAKGLSDAWPFLLMVVVLLARFGQREDSTMATARA